MSSRAMTSGRSTIGDRSPMRSTKVRRSRSRSRSVSSNRTVEASSKSSLLAATRKNANDDSDSNSYRKFKGKHGSNRNQSPAVRSRSRSSSGSRSGSPFLHKNSRQSRSPDFHKPRDNGYYHSSRRKENNFDDFMAWRREEREKIGCIGIPDLWAKSPERITDPTVAGIQKNHQKSKTDSGSKHSGVHDKKKRKLSSKHKKHKHKKKGKKSKKNKTQDESDEEDDSEEKKKSNRKKAKKNKKRSHHNEYKEKDKDLVSAKKMKEAKISGAENSSSDDDSSDSNKSKVDEEFQLWVEKRKKTMEDDDVEDGSELGPLPKGHVQLTSKDYGKALLPGEGAAMAAFVAEGKRIPRRGEIGLTSDQIESYEQVGYVMSGSRHRRMEAVRLRKENQIYSADEKRALAMFNKEERTKRENKILSQFREMISSRLKDK